MCLTAFKAVMEFGGEGGEEDEWNNNERKMIRRPAPTEADKWNTLPEVPNKAAMGYLHLSFEYHKGALKVRVWQISDLLLPPPQISMIYSIFVRGYLIPDKAKKTNRRTEDVLVDLTDGSGNERVKSGIQHIFTPSSFKFRDPLLYTAVTPDIVKERSLQLEVCMTQKQSNRTFLMAMVHMPLRVAVRRPIREKYPLIPCMNVTIPNNMRVYSATDLRLESSRGRVGKNVSKTDDLDSAIPLSARTPREVELEEVVSLSGEDFLRSHLSLCLDEDSDEENDSRRGGLHGVVVTNGVGSGASSTSTLNMPSSGDEGDDDNEDDDIPHVTNGLGVRKRSDKATRKESGQSESSSIEMNHESTTIDMNHVNGGSTFRKKIIPDALTLQDVSDDITLDMPADVTIVDMDISSSSDSQQDLSASSPEPVSPESKHDHQKTLQAGLFSGDAGSPASPENKPARKKIIPSDFDRLALNASSDQAETVERADETFSSSSDTDLPSVEITAAEEDSAVEEEQSTESVPKKKKITVLPSVHHSASKRAAHSSLTDSAHESIPKPSCSSTDSEGLSPHQITDFGDSPFIPASRPETPCWDFYDFDDQLQPEDDTEAVNMTLDESLARLQNLGLGSVHNLSMEPILPMDLADDFDTFVAESEQNADAEQAS